MITAQVDRLKAVRLLGKSKKMKKIAKRLTSEP